MQLADDAQYRKQYRKPNGKEPGRNSNTTSQGIQQMTEWTSPGYRGETAAEVNLCTFGSKQPFNGDLNQVNCPLQYQHPHYHPNPEARFKEVTGRADSIQTTPAPAPF